MTDNAEQMARRRPTIDDVARRAGVSSAAVSFAMNGRRGVGEATRARILEAAAELGWSPSATARALGRGRAGAIGLLLARPVETLEVDPFFLRFLAGVERGLASTDHALLLRVLDDDGPVDPAAYARLAAQGRVDGFLLSDVELEDPRIAVLAGAGLPAVVAGRPAGPCPFPALETRHAEGLTAATAHLVERGHERIGFLAGVERALASTDHALLLRVLDDDGPVDPEAYGRLAAQGRVDGFLLSDVELEDPRIAVLAGTGLPAVVAGRPAGPCPFPALETRHAEGLAAATAHLVERGHERIGFLGGMARFEFEQARLEAWRKVLVRAGLEPGPVAFGDAAAVLDERPTALVCTSDALAAGALAAARERGVAVPGELAITGFDDSSLAALASPPLTTVRIDYAQFGEAAAAALLAAISGAPPPVFEPAAPRLIVRASSG